MDLILSKIEIQEILKDMVSASTRYVQLLPDDLLAFGTVFYCDLIFKEIMVFELGCSVETYFGPVS